MLRSVWITALFSLALAGCNTTRVAGCPPLVTYSPSIQKKLAGELRKLPKGSSLRWAMVDYSKLRDACRVVQ